MEEKMEPKYLILVCLVLFILLSSVVFYYINKSKRNRNINTEKPIIIARAKGVYSDDENNNESSNII
jgi:CHASE3 domain sensor protein